ncbi:MAG: hypothetical protein QM723_16530 [Myxococcaceae bacterium]
MFRLKTQVFCVAFATLCGCKDPVDQAAKQRIFSPEDPPQAVAAAKQKLPPEDVADKPEVARRVLGMGAAETTERIGPHHFTARLKYEWTSTRGTVSLAEERTFLAGPGGVSGDFSASETNNQDQGLDVMRVKGQVFARSRYGKFRERKRDRGIGERMREEIYGGVKDFDRIFKGRMKLTAQGTATVHERTAWRYVVSLGPASDSDADKKLPALAVAKNGADETTAKRLHFYEARDPRALQGEVLVDQETSVVVKARLDGRLGVVADGGDGAELHLTLDSDLSDIGKDPQLKPPPDFLPDEDKPSGIEAALERFGIPRQRGDGGVPPKGGAEEPSDDSE